MGIIDTMMERMKTIRGTMDNILPITAETDVANLGTSKTEVIAKTWAQVWVVRGDKDWSVQIDLGKGQVISITE